MSIELIEQIDLTEKKANKAIIKVDPKSIMVDIEGAHSNVLTGNYTQYTPEGLIASIPSWTDPYEKPCIMYHNEEDGKIIGRIKAVTCKQTDTRSDTPALLFTVNIPDEEAKQQIEDGRLSTVSIGINATDVRCSICGQNIAEGKCGHKRGQHYDDKLCYWIVNAFTGKELSYVITPSDPYAHNVKIYSPDDNVELKETQEQMLMNENLDTTISDNSENVLNNETVVSNNDSDNNSIVNTQITESENNSTEQSTVETDNTNTKDSTVQIAESDTTVTSETTTENQANTTSENITEENQQDNSSQTKSDVLINELFARYTRLLEEHTRLQSRYDYLMTDYNDIESKYITYRDKYNILISNEINNYRVRNGQQMLESEDLSKRSTESLENTLNDLKSDSVNITESENKDSDKKDEATQPITESLHVVESPVEIIKDTDNCNKSESSQSTKIDIREKFDNLGKILFNY